MDCAPHLLYQLVWYFGEIEVLHAIAQRYAPGVELENHGIIAGRLAGGALFSVELSLRDRVSARRTGRDLRQRRHADHRPGARPADGVLPRRPDHHGTCDHRGAVRPEHTWKSARSRWKWPTSSTRCRAGAAAIDLEDAIYTVRLVEVAYESVATGAGGRAAATAHGGSARREVARTCPGSGDGGHDVDASANRRVCHSPLRNIRDSDRRQPR